MAKFQTFFFLSLLSIVDFALQSINVSTLLPTKQELKIGANEVRWEKKKEYEKFQNLKEMEHHLLLNIKLLTLIPRTISVKAFIFGMLQICSQKGPFSVGPVNFSCPFSSYAFLLSKDLSIVWFAASVGLFTGTYSLLASWKVICAKPSLSTPWGSGLVYMLFLFIRMLKYVSWRKKEGKNANICILSLIDLGTTDTGCLIN